MDEDKFQQIITNLIDNACKYSGCAGNVEISTSFFDSENVMIKVKDSGVGIRPEDYNKVFEKFVRLENHLTSKTQGNGLGLYITKKLVDSMDGKIWFESELSCGTVFFVKFPFFNQEEALKCSRQS